MMTEETRVKNEINEFLDRTGWFHFHVMQGKWSYKGISDIIAVRRGQVAFIEVKSKTGKLSKFQEEFNTNITDHGGLYVVTRSYRDIQSIM